MSAGAIVAMSGPGITPYGGHAGQVLAVAYAPDRATLATGGSDGTVRIWDARTGQQQHQLTGHTGGVRSVAYAPDGATLATGPAETCTGDPARLVGNEFVFSMLAQQNIETLNEAAPRTIVASCPHCFNTISREYPAARRELRGDAPHPAAGPPRLRRQAHPGQRHPGEADLP